MQPIHGVAEQSSPMPSALPELGTVQEMIANCYFHLGLPALVRPLRERYQLDGLPQRKMA